MRCNRLSTLILFTTLLLSPLTPTAHADTGISDERLSLPDGPGSIGGVGENAAFDANLGTLSHMVPLDLPEGFAGATPSVALAYNSGAGNEELGIGWMLRIPHIERFSLRGLPRYDGEDVFAADGSEELVRISGPAQTQVFRARFEGGFVRYTWHAEADGKAGYFVAEYPDGRRGFFGADAAGTIVDSARIKHPQGGVFRYLLVETLDRFGHSVRYQYKQHGNYALLDEISYLFTGTTPRYRVRFAYQTRSDIISSCLAGFDLVLDQRLSGIQIFSNDTVLRRYALSYTETSAGTSQLTQVRQYGLADALFPVIHSFAYSQSLSSCADCSKPVVVNMGTLSAGGSGGVDLQNGRSTLIDINGDALPDVLDTGANGAHRFFLNTMAVSGTQSFAAPTASTQTRGGSAFTLSAPGVQAVDVNGDGFTDLIHTVANRVLCNRGTGDWTNAKDCAANVAIEGLSEDEAGDSDPLHIRFFDYDNDKRIDLLHTTADDHTAVLHNLSSGFTQVSVDAIGKVFDDSALQLGDINGDGLLDPVEIIPRAGLSYRLNLGRGVWGPWVSQALSGADETELAEADLQDLNGDGLDDVVVVAGNTVKYALNRAGTFLGFETIGAEQVEGELPTRTDSTTVLFADMNASGSSDVVWITSAGEVRFLELFAVRPNLLTRIDNGIGAVQLTEYGTSARQQARDQHAGLLWRYRLPQAMNVVTATDNYATLTPAVRNRIELSYHHGFYDGIEKRYRGFEVVEQAEPADAVRDNQEAGLTVMEFDLGVSDPYYSGKLLRQQVYGGPDNARYLVQRLLHEYEDCPLTDIPTSGLRLPIRYVCNVASETLLQEGRPEAEWVTLRSEQAYNGYGNVVLSANYGVSGMGARGREACGVCTAPEGALSGACGAECSGDEAFTETQYIEPGDATGGAWILGQASRSIAYGSEGGTYSEQLTYYDGVPFEGLASGKLSHGLVARVCARETAEAAFDCIGSGWVMTNRVKHDGNGKVIETLDPLGARDDDSGHRRRVEYDAYGLKPQAVEVYLSNADGPYRLRRELSYDPIFYEPVAVTRWILVGAPVSSAPAPTRVAYDAFGRRAAIAQPGDTLDAPTSSFDYELSDPVSAIVVRSRSVSGAAFDLEQRQCVDGFGRTVQTKTRLADDLYQVTGFRELNRRGAVVRVYQAYQEQSRDCGGKLPTEVKHTSYRYDALGRPLSVTSADAELYGQASVASTTYAPLQTMESDPEDNDPQSPAFNTPHVTRVDGLGRVTTLERYLSNHSSEDAVVGRITVLYDELGNVAGYLDAKGYRKTQRFDLLGRVLHVDDPNAGPLDFAYDAAGNLIERSDARGATLAMRYDGANRQLSQWDASQKRASMVETRYDFAAECADCTNGEGQALHTRYPLGSKRGSGLDEVGYDLRGQTVLSARTLMGHRFVTAATYDNAGRVQSKTYPDGTKLTHQYDAASRLVAIPDVLDALTYDGRGLLEDLTYANGVHATRKYDVVERVSEAKTVDAHGTVLQGVGYRRDRMGNPLAMEDLSSERAGRPVWDARFTYDAWYRVLTASYGASDEAQETLTFTFDVLDNVTRKVSSRGASSQAHVGDYSYDDSRPNAVLEAGALHYEYDDAGRMLRRGQTDLSWDYQGRLSEASDQDGPAAEYVYGPGVDRVLELRDGGATYYVGPSFEVRDGISVTYARVGRERVARTMSAELQTLLFDDVAPKGNVDGKIDVADAWLISLAGDDPAGYLKASARRLLLEGSPKTVFLHHDHLGSLTLATGTGGEVLGERAFYPTGDTRQEIAFVDAYGFTGQRQDESTGLTHFQFRELDTTSGRWASPDPLFAVAQSALLGKWGESTTAYAYVAGSFLALIDPTGLGGAHSTPAKTSTPKQTPPPPAAKSKQVLLSELEGKHAENVADQVKAHGRVVSAEIEVGQARNAATQGHLTANALHTAGNVVKGAGTLIAVVGKDKKVPGLEIVGDLFAGVGGKLKDQGEKIERDGAARVGAAERHADRTKAEVAGLESAQQALLNEASRVRSAPASTTDE